MIPKLNPLNFEWTLWRNGSSIDIFGVPLRPLTLAYIKPIAIRYAVGYCDGESLVCRPKADAKAVMFFKDGTYYWFHMLNPEFDYIFVLTPNAAFDMMVK